MSVECAIDGWPRYGEELGEIADGILAGGVHAAEFPLLTVGQFGLLAAQFPFVAGDGHALAGAHADEIGFELGEGGEDIEEHLAHGIVRVVERSSEGQFHASFQKLISDGAGIRDGPGEAVGQRKHAGLTVEPDFPAHISPLGEATPCSSANTGGQNVDSGLSVRFCPLPESTRGVSVEVKHVAY